MKTFEEFLKAMETDSELKTKGFAMLEALEDKSEEAKLAAVVKLAQENGYDVSVEDFSAAQAGVQKLDDAELKLASGGYKMESCIANYRCGLIWNKCVFCDECLGIEDCETSFYWVYGPKKK